MEILRGSSAGRHIGRRVKTGDIMERKACELLKKGQQLLKEAGIEEWNYDSRVLLEWICQISRMDLLLSPNMEVTEEKAKEYETYLLRRASHEPLQYLMGEWEFMGIPFRVNPSVLIPRQDTEVLVEWILEQERESAVSKKMLDVCTGSGCIAISLDLLGRKEAGCPWNVEALDVSLDALATAKENGQWNEAQVVFHHSDMFAQVTGKYDVIVSNPPYIPTAVVDGLMAEVVEHEPRLALDGKEDGLFFYRILAKEGKEHLNPGGRIYLEIGHDQGTSVPELLAAEGFSQIEVRKDLAGNDRCVRAIL